MCPCHNNKLTPSAAYTERSVHWVPHAPTIVCRPYILTMSSWTLNVASASGVPPYRLTATSQFSIRASKVKSPRHIPTVWSWLTDQLSLAPGAPPIGRDQPPPSTPPILLDHSLQVHLQTCSITVSECISESTRSWPPSASLSSLDLQVHLQTCSVTASECISDFTRSSSSGAPPIALKHRLQPVQIYFV